MADLKISQLPNASTPLAGTEVLPIVQAGVTDKVTVDNLLARLTAAPPAIGTTTPAAGSFTTLAATSGLSIGRTAVTAPASTDGNVFSGTYTPTLTNTTNVASSTAYTCQYLRVGDVVSVSGKVDLTATATGSFVLGLSLPVASDLATGQNVGGTFAAFAVSETNAGAIYADSTNNRATLQRVAQTTGGIGYYFHFTYLVR